MRIVILYNEPVLPPHDPDYASEAGVLDSVEAAERALRAAGHHVARQGTGRSLPALVGALSSARPDVVMNFCEGFAGAASGEPFVTGLLELLGVPYTGSGPECLALVRHKARTKWLLRGAGLPTAAFEMVPREGPPPWSNLERLLALGPVIVKPAAEDASLGLGKESVVESRAALDAQIESVRKRYGETLVEQFVPGREFNVGLVAVPDLAVLPLAEIEFQAGAGRGWNIVTYEAKWSADSEEDRATPVRCPADVPLELAERIRAAAVGAFQRTGCRDYARVDLRVDDQGQVFILEVNGNPDLGPAAGLAGALRASGWDYDDFMTRLVETASRRGRQVGSVPPVGRACSDPEPESSSRP